LIRDFKFLGQIPTHNTDHLLRSTHSRALARRGINLAIHNAVFLH